MRGRRFGLAVRVRRHRREESTAAGDDVHCHQRGRTGQKSVRRTEAGPDRRCGGGNGSGTDESVREAAKNVRVWPVSGSTQAAYSVDALQYNATTQDWRTHAGVDLAASVGTPVKAAGSGVVTAVYDDEFLGTTVVINHPDGHVSQYSNLAVMPSVSAGDSVEAGQTIGAVGETALLEIADEPHLHFAVYANGDTIDPAEFIR